jgi:thiosulfate/3-mercaptopyruvate sulfurtransferase
MPDEPMTTRAVPAMAVPVPNATPLTDAAALAELLRGQQPGAPVLLDVRWTLAGSDQDGYLAAHIPGAVFVDLDRELAAPPGLGGRHPLPDAADLQALWRAAGIDDDATVVVYDGGSGLASARAWWLLRWSGLRDVRVLDGGLAAWLADGGRPTSAGAERAQQPGTITVRPGAMPVVEVDRATELAESGGLIDARAAARYRGEIEPLDPVAGHIPGSLNLPIGDLQAADGTFRSAAELRAAFAALGVLPGQTNTVAASCGSGITACQLILAAEVAGLEFALYPGSYSQWCALGRPVAVGD